MDEDDYNVIDGIGDQDLAYPIDDNVLGDEVNNVLMELNGIGRRPGKRRFDEYDGIPSTDHPIDWHMRMPITLEEREAKRQKQLVEDEIVERLTARILDARQSKLTAVGDGVSSASASSNDCNKEQIMRLPPIDGSPWLGVSTDGNEERFYIRLYRQGLTIPKANERSNRTRAAVIESRSQATLADEVNKVRNIMEKRASHRDAPVTAHPTLAIGGGLWVNKYAPHIFADLLSDDGINRNLLTWLKLWDECVFRNKITNIDNLVSEKEKDVYTLDTGRIRRPLHKVLLLSGPAGLGKTTLAGIVSRHAGYATVEMNASDNRNIIDFERVLEGAIRSVRTIDGANTGRPNCLIIDEIDGAPAEAVRFLVKALQVSGKKAIRRPIICICNNLFTPSLRELRGIALSIQMTPPRIERLVDRLQNISSKEHIRVDRGTLTQLVNLCHSDIRLSINILQYVATGARSENRIVGVSEMQKAVERERVGSASIFDNWSQILDFSHHLDSKGLLCRESERIRNIQRVVMDCGDDRFVGGLHANYTRLSLPIGILRKASILFLYYDRIMRTIHERQNFSIMRYLISFYATLHLTVATHNKVQLKYPQLDQSMLQRSRESQDTILTVRSKVSVKCSPTDLVRDVLPMIVSIVQPPIKPMNEHLYSKRELQNIQSVIEIMAGYNLTFAPVVINAQLHYTFLPPIDILTMFDLADSSHRVIMPSSTRQMISRKIEQLRVRVAVGATGSQELRNDRPHTNTDLIKKLARDTGFKNIKAVSLHFKYNQGFSNAVKKNIRMSHLLF